MTSQEISGDLAKVFTFTELKNFAIALACLWLLIVISEIHRFRILLCTINLVKFVFNYFQNLNV